MIMMKHEFEELAIKGNESISDSLYNIIERFYMSENDYHRTHGGLDESRYEFVKRVFGGKVNTPRTIAKKILLEEINENTYALQGCTIAGNKKKMDEMNLLIAEYVAYEAVENHGIEYQEMKNFFQTVL